jgi:hypothetical protein
MTGSPDLKPPNFFSLEFHTRFFPHLIWSKLNSKEPEVRGTAFGHSLELTILLFSALFLIVIGTPLALDKNSWIGWGLALAGVAGIVFIFAMAFHQGLRPTYDGFLVWIFMFFAFLGLTVGLFGGSVNHDPRWMTIGFGFLGAIVGYFMGIGAGLWFQVLGWLAGLLSGLAGILIAGLVILDMILLAAD